DGTGTGGAQLREFVCDRADVRDRGLSGGGARLVASAGDSGANFSGDGAERDARGGTRRRHDGGGGNEYFAVAAADSASVAGAAAGAPRAGGSGGDSGGRAGAARTGIALHEHYSEPAGGADGGRDRSLEGDVRVYREPDDAAGGNAALLGGGSREGDLRTHVRAAIRLRGDQPKPRGAAAAEALLRARGGAGGAVVRGAGCDGIAVRGRRPAAAGWGGAARSGAAYAAAAG